MSILDSPSTHALLYVDGELREARSGNRFDVINPADETVIGSAADGSAEDVGDAVAAARRAFDETDWSTNHEFRLRCLEQLQSALKREAASAHELLQAEAGTPAGNLAPQIDGPIDDMSFVMGLIKTFDWQTDFPPFEILGLSSNRQVSYEPYGVVGAITPWNAPFMTNLWKTAPALAAGNTMVLKTPPDTPLTGDFLARVIDQQTDIPPGVFNLISSADKAEAGEALTGDPRVDMFAFTGSAAVGRRIAERAAKGIRKVCLELGGKSANIVLDDANLELASMWGAGLCMNNSGQGCVLPTRMIVHESVYDEMLDRLTAIVGATPWGDPRDPANVVGPIIREEQLERMEGLVDRARADGAKILVGGARGDRGGKGFWYLPTLVAGVGEDSEIAQTEVFGPVLTVLRYQGDDREAVRMANNTPYGLSAYIQTSDEDRAWAIAHRLRSGTVNIGMSFHLAPNTPTGGYGISGLGREGGLDGFKEYLQAKTIASPAR